MADLFKIAVLCLQASILLLVFAIGLHTTWDDALFLFRRPALLLKSLAARNVVMPVVAVLLVELFPLPSALRIAIVVLAVTPVPPLLPRQQLSAGGRQSYAYGLLVSHSVLAVVLIPITIELMNLYFGTQAHFAASAVAAIIGKTVLAPIAAGMLVRRWLRARAGVVARACGTIGSTLLVAGAIPILIASLREIAALIGNGSLLVLAVFVGSGLAAGYLLGGPDAANRTSLALATASRHPALAIAIASAAAPAQSKIVAAAVVLYLIVRTVICVPFARWSRPTGEAQRAQMRQRPV